MTQTLPMTPKIRTLRKKLNLSPEDFATTLGFAGRDRRITVWRWESGRRRPSDQTIMLMRNIAKLGG
jgi:DNA-binding transcriptional regulator YiaG